MNITAILDKVKGFFIHMDPAKRKRLIVLAVILVIGLVTFSTLLNRTSYTALYSGLSTEEAGEIYTKIQDMGVSVKMQGDSTLLVDSEKADECRMTLAAQGYPQSGLSYDLYMDNATIGTSEADKNKLMVFQLQDRLQNTIETLDGVRDAIVTLSIPDDAVFALQEERKDATASVVLDLGGNTDMSNAQVEAIRNLVAKSVSGLTVDNVSIVDTNMKLLGDQGDDALSATTDRYTLQKSLESDYQQSILSMLEPIYGSGQVKAAVSVTLNFDTQSTESVEYQPVVDDKGIPVTVDETKDKSESTGETGQSDSSTTQSSVSYQVNQTIKRIEQAQGSIQSLSASVVINEDTLDEETIEKIRDIAAYAMGTDGQTIHVVALPFAQSEVAALSDDASKVPSWLTENLVMGGAAILFTFVLLLIGLMTFRKKEAKPIRAIEAKASAAEPGPPAETVEEIRLRQDTETGYKKEIEKFVDKRPDEVARLLKRWVSDEQ